MTDFLIQLLGFLAIGSNIISVQFNTHKRIMFFKSLGSLLFAIHYIFLHAWIGVAMDLIGTVRNIIFSYNVQKNKSNQWWIIGFATFTVGVGIATIISSWENMLIGTQWLSSNYLTTTLLAIFCSILSIIAKFISTVGYGFNNPQLIRKINLASSSCWLSYNFIYFSIPGVVNELMVLISDSIALIRFRKKAKSD